ncbi:hypothetical protein FACS1894105_04110 [Clostridia bacterium]|nr:hypothetical protein FACS1894105_04110 [Clostridia bacterium]
MQKRILAALLSLLCVVGVAPTAISASADTPTSVGTYWISLQSITLTMSYSGGQVTWNGLLMGGTTTVGMSATYTLQKKNANGTYTNIATWGPYSSTSYMLSSSGSATTSKGTYRLTVNGTVIYNIGAVETVTDNLEKTFK